jgi:tagatose-1,6-bisphosphate aldolase non-catalytic subunit AgaZ/GatZ
MAVSAFSVFAAAKDAKISDAKTKEITQNMIKACQAELKATPSLNVSDREAVWNALEKIEQTGQLSPACDAAEEVYEKQFHHKYWQEQEEKEKGQEKKQEIKD